MKTIYAHVFNIDSVLTYYNTICSSLNSIREYKNLYIYNLLNHHYIVRKPTLVSYQLSCAVYIEGFQHQFLKKTLPSFAKPYKMGQYEIS